MGLLDRFFGDDLHLTRPDFSRFEHIELDFSGTKIRFIDAAHTASFPIHSWPSDLNIFSREVLEQFEDGTYGEEFYVRGWDFIGKKGKNRGGCSLQSFIYYFPDKHPENASYFSRSILEQELIEHCHILYGVENPESRLGFAGTQVNYRYPVDASGFHYQELNGTNWCRFVAQYKGDPPIVQYAIPITRHHILLNVFKFYAYDGLDFYSPETNLEQTCNDVVHNIMSSYYVELSSRSQAERALADDPV